MRIALLQCKVWLLCFLWIVSGAAKSGFLLLHPCPCCTVLQEEAVREDLQQYNFCGLSPERVMLLVHRQRQGYMYDEEAQNFTPVRAMAQHGTAQHFASRHSTALTMLRIRGPVPREYGQCTGPPRHQGGLCRRLERHVPPVRPN